MSERGRRRTAAAASNTVQGAGMPASPAPRYENEVKASPRRNFPRCSSMKNQSKNALPCAASEAAYQGMAMAAPRANAAAVHREKSSARPRREEVPARAEQDEQRPHRTLEERREPGPGAGPEEERRLPLVLRAVDGPRRQ